MLQDGSASPVESWLGRVDVCNKEEERACSAVAVARVAWAPDKSGCLLQLGPLFRPTPRHPRASCRFLCSSSCRPTGHFLGGEAALCAPQDAFSHPRHLERLKWNYAKRRGRVFVIFEGSPVPSARQLPLYVITGAPSKCWCRHARVIVNCATTMARPALFYICFMNFKGRNAFLARAVKYSDCYEATFEAAVKAEG